MAVAPASAGLGIPPAVPQRTASTCRTPESAAAPGHRSGPGKAVAPPWALGTHLGRALLASGQLRRVRQSRAGSIGSESRSPAGPELGFGRLIGRGRSLSGPAAVPTCDAHNPRAGPEWPGRAERIHPARMDSAHLSTHTPPDSISTRPLGTGDRRGELGRGRSPKVPRRDGATRARLAELLGSRPSTCQERVDRFQPTDATSALRKGAPGTTARRWPVAVAPPRKVPLVLLLKPGGFERNERTPPATTGP